MKKAALAILLSVILMMSAGCGSEAASREGENGFRLQVRVPDGADYKLVQEITDPRKAKAAWDILGGVSWENAIVSMSRQPDLTVTAVGLETESPSGAASYGLWQSPQRDAWEVVAEGPTRYGKLDRGQSRALFAIIKKP